jgi:anti-sigma regulatory factor (Ser/Thr protein kinase)
MLLRLFISGIFLVSLNFVYGSTTPLRKELYAIHYGQHNGLPTTDIYDLAQDDKGIIYMATGKGLYSYDGFSFESLNENVDHYMGGSALSVYQKDTLFFESFDGYVYQYHQKQWKVFNVNKPVHFLKYGLYKDTIFIVQKQGIDVYNIAESTYLRTVRFPVGSPQHTIQIGADYFLINEDYLIKTNSRSLQKKVSLRDISSIKTIRQLYHYGGKLYVVARSEYQEGIWVFDLALNFLYKIDVPEVEGVVRHVDFIDDRVWLSTNKGIFVYQGASEKWRYQESLFDGANVSRILKGKNGEYWISVTGKGLYLVPNPTQYVYTFANENISRIISDSKGFLVGTNKGKIYRLEENFSSASFVLQTPMKTSIYYLYQNPARQDLFYVPSLGFYHVTPDKNIFYDLALKSVVDIDHKYYVLATSSHLLLYAKQSPTQQLAASAWDTVFERNKDTRGFARLMDGLRSKTVCYDQQLGRIYTLTNAGLFVVDQHGKVEELLINKQSIIADQMQFAEQKLYYLTYSGELHVFSEGNVKKLEVDSRVLDFKLFGTSLVLKTNDGFVLYDIRTNRFRQVSFKCEPSSIEDFSLSEKSLVVLMPSGLTEVPIGIELKEYDFPTFIIEHIKIGDKQILPEAMPHRLPYDSNSLEINYALLDYTYPSSYSLYYRINKGIWEKLSASSRKLQFHQLSSGTYQVEFKINEQLIDQQVVFVIERAYWETWWFYVLISVAAVLLVSYYYRRRRQKLQAQIRLLEDKIALEKKLEKSLLTSIKAQMNPHFYFNALNSIQAFIYKNDKGNALEYLSKFSKLTRNILAQTEMDSIVLEDEISMLQLYLDLEKVRFSDRFSYTIECLRGVDKKTIRIPAMLIQPYVENAVKHGFTKHTTNGLIRIVFEKMETYLNVTVEDNGIGRMQAAVLNKTGDQPSFSSEANKRRLEILNSNADNKVSVLYEDLVDERGIPSGTRVRIVIPVSIVS